MSSSSEAEQLADVRAQLAQARQQLAAARQKLSEEVNAAADFVQSLLPQRLQDEVATDWAYISSTRLGGDLFGYHWLDSEKLAIYLFDVCGHGVGASLLSVSVFDVLRRQSLANTDFDRPCHVLAELNEAFPMERHGDRFFTIWYGVYDISKRTLRYAHGGHPPAVMFRPGKDELLLSESSMMIGAVPDATFGETTARIEPGARLYLMGDGAFEAASPSGEHLGLERFVELLTDAQQLERGRAMHVWNEVRTWQGREDPQDDFSLLEVEFT